MTNADGADGSTRFKFTFSDTENTRYHRCKHGTLAMKQAQRKAIASRDLTEAEIALIDAAEIPVEHRYSFFSVLQTKREKRVPVRRSSPPG